MSLIQRKNMFTFNYFLKQIIGLPIETYNNQLLKIYNLNIDNCEINLHKINYVKVQNTDELNDKKIIGIPAIIVKEDVSSTSYINLEKNLKKIFRINGIYALISIKKYHKEDSFPNGSNTPFYATKTITLKKKINLIFLSFCIRKKIYQLTDKEYFNIPHIPMEYIPCRYAFNLEYKNYDTYKNELECYSNEQLVDNFNKELSVSHNQVREVRLVAYHHIFSNRFNTSPITRIDNNVIILNNKAIYIKELDTILCYPEIN
jgi:hypothetical protein